MATLNIFNETSRRHFFADYFTRGMNPEMAKRMMSDLGMKEEHAHVEHARKIQTTAVAKQQQHLHQQLFQQYFGF